MIKATDKSREEAARALDAAVRQAVEQAPVVDLHTHLYAPQFGSLCLSGIDELLTYHYLIAETLRANRAIQPEDLLRLSKPDRADVVWRTLFIDRSPLSEACVGIMTVLRSHGLDPRPSDLREARAFFSAAEPHSHLDRVLELAGVQSLVMTNDPCDDLERAIWESKPDVDRRFHAALRLDRALIEQHENLEPFLERWIGRMRPKYLALSSTLVPKLPEAVLAACRHWGLPLAMMIGVRRGVNPRLAEAGDGCSTVDLEPLEKLARDHPDVRLMVTVLSRENAHALCVVARKFSNVLPFGCWWFMNNPSLVEEVTLMRLEMLGPTFVPQHSDARVLEQLIYKWRHARTSIGNALITRYNSMPDLPSSRQIEQDARVLLGGIAREWLS
jgi:hypothetical protein